MHQTDESAPVQDLLTLTAIYRRIVEKYFDDDWLKPKDRRS
jgi:acetylornithine deacetylase/succinyl-diaminopimelate desuccinylase-like protein